MLGVDGKSQLDISRSAARGVGGLNDAAAVATPSTHVGARKQARLVQCKFLVRCKYIERTRYDEFEYTIQPN